MVFMIRKSLAGVQVDATLREIHESDLLIAEHPVEFGASVSDHAIVLPKRLILEGVAGSRGGPAAVTAAWQTLKAAQESREPFSIVTALDVYRNMLIERITVDRDRAIGRVLYFRAELREVIIVDTETTQGTRSGTSQSGLSRDRLAPGTPRDRGAPVEQRGNVATQAVSGADAERVNRSALVQIFNPQGR